MVGRERQTHLDMAGMDRYMCVRVKIRVVCACEYVSVYSMCVCLAGGTGAAGVWCGVRANAAAPGWIWPKLK